MSTQVLVVCRANRCRSPLAAALLRRAADRHGLDLDVRSAGVLGEGLGEGAPVTDDVAEVAAGAGLDLSQHTSRGLDALELSAADLVLCLSRRQLQAVALAGPGTLPRAFTLPELLERAAAAGGPRGGEPVARWLGRVGGGRGPSDVLRLGAAADVADPTGHGPAAHRELLARLERDVDRLVALLGASAARGAA